MQRGRDVLLLSPLLLLLLLPVVVAQVHFFQISLQLSDCRDLARQTQTWRQTKRRLTWSPQTRAHQTSLYGSKQLTEQLNKRCEKM